MWWGPFMYWLSSHLFPNCSNWYCDWHWIEMKSENMHYSSCSLTDSKTHRKAGKLTFQLHNVSNIDGNAYVCLRVILCCCFFFFILKKIMEQKNIRIHTIAPVILHFDIKYFVGFVVFCCCCCFGVFHSLHFLHSMHLCDRNVNIQNLIRGFDSHFTLINTHTHTHRRSHLHAYKNIWHIHTCTRAHTNAYKDRHAVHRNNK